VQILADAYGHVMHLGTRDCSIQRRHQKLLEIAPADLPKNVLDAMHTTAIQAARQAGYVNAGTVEFLVDPKTNDFWFMEVNTRLQVEHTVTEILTASDINPPSGAPGRRRPLEIPEERIHLVNKPSRCVSMRRIRKTISCPKAASASKCTNRPAVRKSASTALSTRAIKFPPTTIRSWSS
jgi:hypothetical protein